MPGTMTFIPFSTDVMLITAGSPSLQNDAERRPVK